MRPRMTMDRLRELGACTDGQEEFRRLFPLCDVELSEENVGSVIRSGARGNLWWAFPVERHGGVPSWDQFLYELDSVERNHPITHDLFDAVEKAADSVYLKYRAKMERLEELQNKLMTARDREIRVAQERVRQNLQWEEKVRKPQIRIALRYLWSEWMQVPLDHAELVESVVTFGEQILELEAG